MKNIKMVEAARNKAMPIIEKDIELDKSPLLKETLKSKNLKLHFK